HVTTMHTGRPVVEHGMYEWNIYEPSLDALVTPLMFSFAGDADRDTLRGTGADVRTLYLTATLYRRLSTQGVRCIVLHPSTFAPSTYDGVLLDGATLHPYDSLAAGFETLGEELHARSGPTYAYVYIDTLDFTGHHHGPSSEAFDAEAVRCLDGIEAGLGSLPPNTLLLLAADHGQLDVHPDRTRFVNVLWPEIASYLRRDRAGRPLAPAGSARDFFLQTAALVAEGLFTGAPGPRLRERIGDVCILPAAGETVWWRERGRFGMRFRGHHGGLTPEEAHTHVTSLMVG